jgi:magnesium transporter
LLYEVLDDLLDYCFRSGQDRLQARCARGRRRGVRRSSRHLQCQAGDHSYRKIIKPERSIRLPSATSSVSSPEELELYFDDIVDSTERIWDILDNYKEVVEALEATNESVISHRQNDVLRILTVFSVVLLPLTLITGFFGMNVNFPGFGTTWAFWTIVGLMVVSFGALIGFFRFKRWI